MNDAVSCAVGSPDHYRRKGIEFADIVDAFGLGPWEAQALKYLLRADIKEGGARGGEDRAKGIACMIRALMTRDPGRLDGFEAFGFRLVRIKPPAQPDPAFRPRDFVGEAVILNLTTVADVADRAGWSLPALCSTLSDFSVDHPVRPEDALSVALEFAPRDHDLSRLLRACAADAFDEGAPASEPAR